MHSSFNWRFEANKLDRKFVYEQKLSQIKQSAPLFIKSYINIQPITQTQTISIFINAKFIFVFNK